jgi:hypothetical protein
MDVRFKIVGALKVLQIQLLAFFHFHKGLKELLSSDNAEVFLSDMNSMQAVRKTQKRTIGEGGGVALYVKSEDLNVLF